MNRVPARRFPLEALVPVVLAAAFLSPAWLGGMVPTYRDFTNLFLPHKLYVARSLAEGRFPLWAPEPGFGTPFLAGFQSELLYPPSWIVFVFPGAASIGLWLAFHFALGGVGLTCLLRRRGIPAEAAALGAIVYAFGGTFVSIAPWGHLIVAAWMPLAIVSVERLIERCTPRRVAATATIFALQIAAGAPESFAQSLLVVLLVAFATPGPIAGRLGGPMIALVLAAGLTAPQWIPAAELLARSERVGGLSAEVAGLWSLEPGSAKTLVTPHRLDGGILKPLPENEFPLFWSVYLGLAPLLCLAAGALSRAGAFWSLLLAGTLLLALGPATPLFSLLHGFAGLFRYPSKWLVTAHLAAAVLVGLGAGRVRGAIEARSGLPAALVVAALGAITVIDLWSVHGPSLLFTDFRELRESAPPGPLRDAGLSTRVFHYQVTTPGLKPWNPGFRIGEDLGAFERGVWRDLGGNVALAYGIGFVAEASGLRRARLARLYEVLERLPPGRGLRLLRALGVSFLAGEDALASPSLETLRRGVPGQVWIHRLEDPAPRIYLASRASPVRDAATAFRRMASTGFLPGHDAVVEGGCPAGLECGPVAEVTPGGEVRITTDDPERLEIEVAAKGPTLLVVGDAWDPGWSATVDGRTETILVANGLMRGVPVPAGDHRILLEYHPPGLRTASWIAGVCLLLTGAALSRREGR